MKLTIEIKDLPAWKQEFLEADYHYAQASIKFEMCKNIEVIKGQGLMGKAFKILKRSSSLASLNIDALLLNLETLRGYKVFEYAIKHRGETSTVKLDVNEEYFKIVEIARQSRFHIGYTREGFLKETEKNLRETYGNVTITRLD
jgi:hypothetical protein